MKLKLKTEYGENKEYITDEKLINGLYLTSTLKYVKRNTKGLHIESKIGSMKCTFLNGYSIITIVNSSVEKLQFLITPNIELEKLDLLSESLFPSFIKELITKCSDLNKGDGRLRDLLEIL